MGVILDSSEIIALERNRGIVENLVAGREEEPFGISVVTVAELLHGVERADTEARRIRRQAFVEKVIEMIPVFPFDTGVARIYARIWASLVQRGFTVGAHDLIIAATAISLDYTVITAMGERKTLPPPRFVTAALNTIDVVFKNDPSPK